MSTGGLWRLVYVSRNCIVGDGDDLELEVERILASSRRNNPGRGITGALLFNEGSFAQVLEGERAAVQECFGRIQVDPRHDSVQLLSLDPITDRTFPNWSMAYEASGTAAAARFGEIARSTDHDGSLLDGEIIFDLVRHHLDEMWSPVR